MKALRGCLAVVLLTTATPRAQDPDPLAWPALYDPYTVLTLNLQMTDGDWNTIRHDTTNEIEVPCQFWADGETPIFCSCRRKSSRALPSEGNPIKVGMKVDINEFVDGQKWHGVTKVSLENGADMDPIAEGLAWNLHEMASIDGFYGAGYHAGLASWVRVYVNGQFIGVYINVEERDSQFLRNRNIHFGGSRTWLYEIDETDPGFFEHEVGGPAHSPLWNELNFSPSRSQPAPVRSLRRTTPFCDVSSLCDRHPGHAHSGSYRRVQLQQRLALQSREELQVRGLRQRTSTLRRQPPKGRRRATRRPPTNG